MRCAACLGSGALDGEATVWSRIDAHQEIRSIRGGRLPADVVAALTLSSQRGDVVHRLEGLRLGEIAAVVQPAQFLQAVVAVLAWKMIERVPEEVDVAALPGGFGQHFGQGAFEAGVVVADGEAHAGQAALLECQQQLAPAGGAFAPGDLDGEDLAAAFDARGWRYYTGEWNDNWYPGYSSSWAALPSIRAQSSSSQGLRCCASRRSLSVRYRASR